MHYQFNNAEICSICDLDNIKELLLIKNLQDLNDFLTKSISLNKSAYVPR